MLASEGESFHPRIIQNIVVYDYTKILVTHVMLQLQSQGQLAGFVVDEAHCVRYLLHIMVTFCFIDGNYLLKYVRIIFYH